MPRTKISHAPRRWPLPGTGIQPAAGRPGCAREDRCVHAVTGDDGHRTPAAAADGPLCPADRDEAAAALRAFPLQYVHLEIEQRALRSALGRGRSAGAVADLAARLAATEPVMRAMEDILAGWDERVADVMCLSRPYTCEARRQRGGKITADASRALLAHFSTLLALPPAEMTRPAPGGEGVEFPLLDGGDAGCEIITLHRRACRILGDTRQLAETLDGVPCRTCDALALERAEPPADPAVAAMFSQCSSCRHLMSREDYDAWAAMYAAWADSQGLTCLRCTAGRCADCAYVRCACRGQGHATAA